MLCVTQVEATSRPLTSLIGSKFEESFVIEDVHCISAVDEAMPAIMGTYAMIQFFEVTSARWIRHDLPPGKVSVFETLTEMRHHRPVGKGATLLVRVRLIDATQTSVAFVCQAFYARVLIGECRHSRSVIPSSILFRAAHRACRDLLPVTSESSPTLPI